MTNISFNGPCLIIKMFGFVFYMACGKEIPPLGKWIPDVQ